MHKVIDPNSEKERNVKYVKKLAEHVEVYVIGKHREWIDFWSLEKFQEMNPDFNNYTKFNE